MEHIFLNSDNLIYECFNNKYFTDEMPPSFSATEFTNKLDIILKHIDTLQNDTGTYCTNLSIYKSEYTRRTISLPNPYSYLKVLQFLSNNWRKVIFYSKSSNSTSPIYNISNLTSYTFEESRKLRCSHSFGYKYILRIDLSNFYNSIYTHSITWALIGKENAKQFVNKKPSQIKNKTYLFGDEFDKLMRKCKGHETNGIIIGPYASRIFSEILLCGIDKILRNEQFKFVRFVDDYNFYFRTKQDAENALSRLHQIFNEFNLTVNKDKISIELFPFENYYDFNKKFNSMQQEEGIDVLLRYALSLYEKGQKGALKYALKIIKPEHINKNNVQEVTSYLVNIMMIRPELAPLCLNILKNKVTRLNSVKKVVNEEIPECIKNGKEQELLWYLYAVISLQINIKIDNIINVLQSGDDFSRILALEIINQHRDLIEGLNVDTEIEKVLQILAKQIVDYDFNGEHWLLLYEIYVRKSIPANFLDYNKLFGKKTDIYKFFRLLKKNKIDFYKES